MADSAAFFAAIWLDEREFADHAARARSLESRLAGWLVQRAAARQPNPVSLVDLGSGTGSNLRHLAPALPAGQHWTLIDHDAGHLEQAERRCRTIPGVVSLTPRRHRLGADGLSGAIPDSTDVVTASALLDLMSPEWITALVARTQRCGSAGFFTLSYSGDFSISPELAEDHWLRDAVNQHQQTDKGTGTALGPDAWRVCADRFEAAGFQVWSEASDWHLGPDARALQGWLVRGWADAVIALLPRESARVERWRQARLASVRAGELTIRVSHRDVLALPAPIRKEDSRVG